MSEDYSRNMPAKRSLHKNPLPSVWEREDVDKLLSAVDRANPMGKRDYAILLLVTKLGLRVGDIRALCLGDIDWENSRKRKSVSICRCLMMLAGQSLIT